MTEEHKDGGETAKIIFTSVLNASGPLAIGLTISFGVLVFVTKNPPLPLQSFLALCCSVVIGRYGEMFQCLIKDSLTDFKIKTKWRKDMKLLVDRLSQQEAAQLVLMLKDGCSTIPVQDDETTNCLFEKGILKKPSNDCVHRVFTIYPDVWEGLRSMEKELEAAVRKDRLNDNLTDEDRALLKSTDIHPLAKRLKFARSKII
jgi:hypothetical protein